MAGAGAWRTTCERSSGSPRQVRFQRGWEDAIFFTIRIHTPRGGGVTLGSTQNGLSEYRCEWVDVCRPSGRTPEARRRAQTCERVRDQTDFGASPRNPLLQNQTVNSNHHLRRVKHQNTMLHLFERIVRHLLQIDFPMTWL